MLYVCNWYCAGDGNVQKNSLVHVYVCNVYVASCETNPLNLIPHYLSTYIPLCLVMIVNPVLYSKTTAAGLIILLFIDYYFSYCSYFRYKKVLYYGHCHCCLGNPKSRRSCLQGILCVVFGRTRPDL